MKQQFRCVQEMGKTQQIEIDFEAGLHQQFPDFMDCVRASVHGCGRPFKAIAADLDMSSSELSRKLSENPNDPVHFQLRGLVRLMQSTGDLRPLHWLIEEFLEDQAAKKERARDELAALMPKIASLLELAHNDPEGA